MRRCLTFRKSFVGLATLLAVGSDARTQQYYWTATTASNNVWSNSSNWLNGAVATGAFSTANFTSNITAQTEIENPFTETTGNLVFSDNGASGSTWRILNQGYFGEGVLNLGGQGGLPSITTTTNAIFINNAGGSLKAINGFVKTGAATLTLGGTGDNTIGNSVLVNQGTLKLDMSAPNVAALGGNVVVNGGFLYHGSQDNQFAAGTVITLASGTFRSDASFSVSSMTLTGGTDIGGSNFTVTLTSSTAPLTIRNTSTDFFYEFSTTTPNAEIRFDATNNGTGIIARGFDVGTVGRRINVEDGTAVVDMRITGAVNGPALGFLTKTGAGTLEYASTTNNMGFIGTTVVSEGVLLLNSQTFNGNGSIVGNLTMNGGTVRLARSNQIAVAQPGTSTVNNIALNSGIFDLNGFSEGFGNLSGTGTGATLILPAGSTLTVNQFASKTFNGVLDGPGAFIKDGSATLTLDGTLDNLNTGVTTVKRGVLAFSKDIGKDAIFGSLNITGTPASSFLGTARIAASGQLPDTTAVTIGDFGKLALANGSSDTIGSLSGSGIVDLMETDSRSGNLTIKQNVDTTFSGVIEVSASPGSGSLVKSGTGTLTLSGTAANDYNGNTTLSDGKLHLAKSAGVRAIGGSITISGGRLRLLNNEQISNTVTVSLTGGAAEFYLDGNSGAAVTETIGALSATAGLYYASAGSMLNVAQTSTTTFAGVLTGSGDLTKSLAGTLILAGYANNTSTGTTFVNGGEVHLNKTAGVDAVASVAVSGGTLKHLASNQIRSGYGVSLSSGTWDLNGFTETIDILSGTGGSLQLGNGSLTVSMTVDSVFSGTLGGTGSFSKSGIGKLTLGGSIANANTGVTTVNAGTLILGKTAGVNAVGGKLFVNGGTARLTANEMIPDANAVQVNDGQFDVQGQSETISELSGTGGSLRILNGGQLLVSQTTTTAFNGSLTGNGGTFWKGASGTLQLGGNSQNDFQGTIKISGGTLEFNKTPGSAVASGPILMTGGTIKYLAGSQTNLVPVTIEGGLLDINGTVQSIGSLAASAGTEVALGTGTITVIQDADAGFDGLLSGTGGFNKGGAATLTFGGALANTFTGTTTINGGGHLQLNKPGGVAALAGDVAIYSGRVRLMANDQLSATAGVTLNGSTAELHLDGNGGGAVSQTIRSLSGTSGLIYMNAGSALTVNQSTNTTYSGIITGDGQFIKSGTGTLTLDGNSSSTNTGLTTVSAGTLEFNKVGQNALGGSVQVNTGATLRYLASDQLGLASGIILAGGALDMGTFSDSIGYLYHQSGTVATISSLTLAATTVYPLQVRDITAAYNVFLTGTGGLGVQFDAANNGTATLTGNLNLGGSVRSFLVDDGTAANDLVLNGLLANGGIRKDGAGTLQLGGTIANTLTSGATVNAGTLVLAKSANVNAIGTGSLAISGGTVRIAVTEQLSNTARVIMTGGTLQLSASETIGDLSGTGGTITLNANALTINQIIPGTYAGNITGTGTINKQGSGTLTLSAPNISFTGVINLFDGKLVINSIMAASSNPISVGNSRTIGGSGTLNRPLAIGGGTLAPGNSVGQLTVGGANTWSGGGTYAFEYNTSASNPTTPGTSNDHLLGSSGSTLNLSAISTTSRFNIVVDALYTGAAPTGNVTYTLATFPTISGMPFGNVTAYFNVSGDYTGTPTLALVNGTTDTLTITFQPVPEPTALLGLGALGMLVLRRRGRR